MSTYFVVSRVLKAMIIVPLFALAGCASAKDPTPSYGAEPAPPDDGKTIENMMAARFPGVTVTKTDDGGLHIRIRGGSNSFYGSSEPLYIVDDAPLDVGPKGLLYINPYDIERIEVLKNPEDVGVYGVRGSNGVIKITMKRPGKR